MANCIPSLNRRTLSSTASTTPPAPASPEACYPTQTPKRPHTPARTATLTRGLVPAHAVWTVTVAGAERHDGEGPYIWVLNASDANTAAVKAAHHHRTTEQDTDTVVR